jgi:twitching motility protein PilI
MSFTDASASMPLPQVAPSVALRPPAAPDSRAAATSPTQASPRTVAQRRHGFRVGNLRLLARTADSSQLIDVPRLTRLPNAPPWMLGTTNLNGMLIPVFDLARWCGLGASQRPTHPMLLVLGHGDDAAGILVDDLPASITVVDAMAIDDHIELAPPVLRESIDAVHAHEDALWFDLRVPHLLEQLEAGLRAH